MVPRGETVVRSTTRWSSSAAPKRFATPAASSTRQRLTGSGQIACQPKRNLAAPKFFHPARVGQFSQLPKREGARRRRASIVKSHPVAKDQRSANRTPTEQPTATQIRDQHVTTESSRSPARQAHRVFIAKMVQSQRANHNIKRLVRLERSGYPHIHIGSPDNSCSSAAPARSSPAENRPPRLHFRAQRRAWSASRRGISAEPVARSSTRRRSPRGSSAS